MRKHKNYIYMKAFIVDIFFKGKTYFEIKTQP